MNQSLLIALMLAINLISSVTMYLVGYLVATNRFQQEAIRAGHANIDSGQWKWKK